MQELKKSLLELCIDREGKKREVLPDALHVIDLEFAIVGGLSWKSEFSRTDKPAAHRARLKDFHHLCKATCKRLSIKYKKVLFCFRDEPSPAGEWHSHFLIGAKGTETVSHADLAIELQDMWTRRFNNGKAKIEPFDPKRQLGGVSYVFKVSRDERGNEIANFPVLSTALLNLIQKRKSGIDS